MEPLIRESLARLLPDQGVPAAGAVGGYWTRGNEIEVDIVGADRGPIAGELLFLGSVKWLENAAFDDHDLRALWRHRDRITERLVPLIAVSRSGVTATGVDAVFGPEELITSWQR